MDQSMFPAGAIQTRWAASLCALVESIAAHAAHAIEAGIRPVRMLATALALTVIAVGWLVMCLLAIATLVELHILTGTGLIIRSPGGLQLAIGVGSVVVTEILALVVFQVARPSEPRASR